MGVARANLHFVRRYAYESTRERACVYIRLRGFSFYKRRALEQLTLLSAASEVP